MLKHGEHNDLSRKCGTSSPLYVFLSISMLSCSSGQQPSSSTDDPRQEWPEYMRGYSVGDSLFGPTFLETPPSDEAGMQVWIWDSSRKSAVCSFESRATPPRKQEVDADFFVISLNNHVAGEYTVLSPTAPFDYEIFHTHALQARVTYYRAGRLTGLVDDRHMAWGGTVEVLTAPPQAFADWGKTPRAAIDIRVKVELAEEESRFEECIFDTPVNNEGELGQDSVRCECFGPDGTRFTCREENDEFVQCCQKDKPRTKLIDLTVTGVGECGWYCNQMMTIPLSYCDLCGEVYEDVGDNEYLCPFPDDTETGEACDGCESLANPRGVLSVRWADGSGEVDDGLYTAKHGPTEQELDRAMVVCGTLPEEYPHSSCFDVLSQETSHSIELSFKDGRTARAEVLVEAYDGCPYRNVSYQIVTVEEGVDGEITFEPVQFIDPCELMDLEESSPFQQIIQTPPFVSSKNRKPAALLLQENRAPLSGPLF